MIGVHFFQLNRFCVNSGDTLFGEPKLFGVPSLTSMIRLPESELCWLDSGGVQWSTDDFEGKLADLIDEFRRFFRELIRSSYDPEGSFDRTLDDAIAGLDR